MTDIAGQNDENSFTNAAGSKKFNATMKRILGKKV
jgi:hypothetical protein